MLAKTLEAPLVGAFARLIGALCDPARRNRTALMAAVVYAAVWALFAVVSKSPHGVHPDMAEIAVWSRNLDWGYPKHPPLPAWVVAIWFSVFPVADWAYHLLAAINLAAGLYFAFLLAGLWLDGEKRAVAPFLLALVPFYNFVGQKLDHNAMLIPLWTLATWAFVQSFERRHLGYAILAGIAAAAALLTKHWSLFLLLGFFVAALCDPQRSAYFRSPAPWISAAVAAILVAPHVVWLIQENFPPIHSIVGRRTADTPLLWLRRLSEYLFGTVGYCLGAILAVAIFFRPERAAWRDMLLPRDGRRRFAAVIFWVPLLAPVAVAAVTRTGLLSLWNMAAVSLLPVILLSSPRVTAAPLAAARVAGVAALISAAALVASPLIGAAKLRAGMENDALYVPAAAAAIQAEWSAATAAPLEIVAGPFGLANSTAFLLKDRPSSYANFMPYLAPWIDRDGLLRRGLAVICPAGDSDCVKSAEALAARRQAARRLETDLTPRWLLFAGAPRRYVIWLLPPQ